MTTGWTLKSLEVEGQMLVANVGVHRNGTRSITLVFVCLPLFGILLDISSQAEDSHLPLWDINILARVYTKQDTFSHV